VWHLKSGRRSSSPPIGVAVEPRDQFRIVELASSGGTYGGRAVMARLLIHELLLFCCMAAFAIGVVIAAASIIG